MMKEKNIVNLFFEQLVAENLPRVCANDISELQVERREAAKVFFQQGVPTQNDERWRHFDWNNITQNSYKIPTPPTQYQSPDDFFTCSAKGLDTYKFILQNGWSVYKNEPLTTFPNGAIVGSMRAAYGKYNQLIQNELSNFQRREQTGIYALCQTLWQDGLFIYIPDNTTFDKVIQLINLLQTGDDLFINARHLVIVGKNASVKLLHCVESLQSANVLLNGTIEVILNKGAVFDYVKLENNDNHSVLLSQTVVYQDKASVLNTYVNSLNGGRIHNSIDVHLSQPMAQARCNGLYLLDKNQSVSHAVSIFHHAPSCQSEQCYNGILDDAAKAEFTSRVYVASGAQQTQSLQLNRNILLTDKATINARPFLEIYADDVKCNHGATVGQMDKNAIFYLQSRGICLKNAKKLLLHAFAKEIVDKIGIDSLVAYSDAFVQKRLSGESTSCSNCIVGCERPIHFEVQVPEI